MLDDVRIRAATADAPPTLDATIAVHPVTPAPRPVPAGRSVTQPRPLVRRRRIATRIKWAVVLLLVAGVAVALALAWRPSPVEVEAATAERGALQVTVDEDGYTRVRDRYSISTPFAGTLTRIALRAGDSVRAGDVVATLVPLTSALLDPRTRQEALARADAARAAREQAVSAIARARAAHTYAAREARRQRALLAEGAVAANSVELLELEQRLRAEELASAEFGLRVAEAEVQMATVALRPPTQPGAGDQSVRIRAPTKGRVLRVLRESAGAVEAGAALLEVGDPAALEVVVDVLTANAVEIRPGAQALIDGWGGDSVLRGRVRLVEPSAFTRLSALGVEEQRVNVILYLDEPRERWATLGDGFRVETRITVWENGDVLRIPAGAVFRSGDGWAVFVVRDGRARLRPIQLGRRTGALAQVHSGLVPGERVIVYPGESVADGTKVETR